MLKFRKYFVSGPENDRRMTHAGQLWYGIMDRVKNRKGLIAYRGVSVSEEFMDFQLFAHWLYSQPNYDRTFHLDKDILVKGNRVYSPNTCCLVPSEINSLMVLQNSKRGALPVGVVCRGNGERYAARLSIDGKQTYLGTCDDPREAFLLYKKNKELLIKQKAEKYREVLIPNCYNSLINWQVEITD